MASYDEQVQSWTRKLEGEKGRGEPVGDGCRWVRLGDLIALCPSGKVEGRSEAEEVEDGLWLDALKTAAHEAGGWIDVDQGRLAFIWAELDDPRDLPDHDRESPEEMVNEDTVLGVTDPDALDQAVCVPQHHGKEAA